jgi:hypothetical protein
MPKKNNKRYWVKYEFSDLMTSFFGPITNRYKTKQAAIDAMKTMKMKGQKISASNVPCNYVNPATSRWSQVIRPMEAIMKIINKEYYRSKPMVNMTDDLVRITITAKRHELRELEMFIKEWPNQVNRPDALEICQCDKPDVMYSICQCGKAIVW